MYWLSLIWSFEFASNHAQNSLSACLINSSGSRLISQNSLSFRVKKQRKSYVFFALRLRVVHFLIHPSTPNHIHCTMLRQSMIHLPNKYSSLGLVYSLFCVLVESHLKFWVCVKPCPKFTFRVSNQLKWITFDTSKQFVFTSFPYVPNIPWIIVFI